MVAFLASLILTIVMTAVVVRVSRRRAPGTPLTWGEAFAAGVFVFTLMFLVYGIVPHQFLTYADNDLKWRSDKIGIPAGPIGKAFGDTENTVFSAEGNTLFPEGVPLPNGQFVITAQVLRDIIASGIYIVFLVAQILMWLSWQRRGKKAAETPELTSAFGRPLVRRA
ncbi:MAG TPA: hypothetical protein VF230_03890 [Acidimicrobiales bacterium]